MKSNTSNPQLSTNVTKEEILKMSREQLTELRDALLGINDKFCTNCEDCNNCKSCTNCDQCLDCIACLDCTKCTECVNCTDLVNALFCTNLTGTKDPNQFWIANTLVSREEFAAMEKKLGIIPMGLRLLRMWS